MTIPWSFFYQIPNFQWTGRNDPGTRSQRMHHVMQSVDLQQPGWHTNLDLNGTCYGLLGFSCDEGVRRNQGRVGAAEGPKALRQALANLPVHHDTNAITVLDCGDMVFRDTSGDSLLDSQQALSEVVQILLKQGIQPCVLGGGHEVAFGHGKGVYDFLKPQQHTLGIINFDAHFDLRPLENNQGSSGTPFKQLADMMPPSEFHYLCCGIQKASNTQSLFDTAQNYGVVYKEAHETDQWEKAIQRFIQDKDALYVTVCLDVLDGAFAPGVSAPAVAGVTPHELLKALQTLWKSGKVISLDIAELAPCYDAQQRTAKLAARLLFEMIQSSEKATS